MAKSNLHYCDLEDVAVADLRDAAEGLGDSTFFTLDPDNLRTVYVSVKELALAVNRSRSPVARIVRRKWATAAAPVQGKGTPMRWSEFEALLSKAGTTFDQVSAALMPPPSQLPKPEKTYLQDTALPILVAEAQRLIDGQPTALAHERGALRFSCGDAAERAGVHHATLAHGLTQLRLWDPNKGRGEYAKLRRTLGKPLDGARLLTLLHEQGVEVESVARRLGEIKGERERANLSGRPKPPDRTGESRYPDPPEFALWVEAQIAAGSLRAEQVLYDLTEVRAMFRTAHPAVHERVRKEYLATRKRKPGQLRPESAYERRARDREAAEFAVHAGLETPESLERAQAAEDARRNGW